MNTYPPVAYAVERRIASAKPDYRDHATCLELALLAKDEDALRTPSRDALAAHAGVVENGDHGPESVVDPGGQGEARGGDSLREGSRGGARTQG